MDCALRPDPIVQGVQPRPERQTGEVAIILVQTFH